MARKSVPQQRPRHGPSEASWKAWTAAVEVREVAMDALEFAVDRQRLASQKDAKVNVQYRLDRGKTTRVENELVLTFEFEMLIHEEGTVPDAGSALVHARMAYRGTYEVPESPETTEALVKRFHERIALAHVFPFVRAQLADLLMRAGLPPLYLPLSHEGHTRRAGR